MQLDPSICYRALLSRDARFDGKFFVAVATTGIYCRPVCPARTPKRANVSFFACAAAAEDAGFRACRRCRPETAPWTPAWQGASVTVTRALRLIEEGNANEENLDQLADRLGVSDRHLRRLFATHLGASPNAVARTQRVHLARRLVDETDLPMTRIAFAAGFASVRNFNEAVRVSFAASPTELRQRSKARKLVGHDGLRLLLPYRPPLAWEHLLGFFATRAIRGVESVSDDSYQRTILLNGQPGLISVRRVEGRNQLELCLRHSDVAVVGTAIERVRRLFDLGADPLPIAAQLGRDPLLAPMLAQLPGLRVPGCWDRFELGVRAIVGQQVSVAGARTLLSRLAERFGTPLPAGLHASESDATLVHLFPTAAQLAAADLTGIGMPGARIAALSKFAQRVACGELDLNVAQADVLQEQMCAQPGIGPWTAQYIAMRGLSEPDAFLPSDLGVRRALATKDGLPAVAEVERRAEAWRPWRAYALMYLWSSCG